MYDIPIDCVEICYLTSSRYACKLFIRADGNKKIFE